MKTKTLYFIIFLLAVIMIFALIYTRGKVSELNQQVPKSTRVEVSEQGRIIESTGPVFFHKEAVTVIKPAQGKKDAVMGLDNKTNDTIEQQNTEISSLSASQASGGGAKSKDSEEAAGVTRLGKYPTKEELNEMNAKGIIIY